jgi:hypothetical protein
MCRAWTPLKLLFEQLQRRFIGLRMDFHVPVGQIAGIPPDSASSCGPLCEVSVSDPLNTATNEVILRPNHFAEGIVAFS